MSEQPKKRRMGMADKVRDFHIKNPRATSLDIAQALECEPEYVRAAARRLGIWLPTARVGRPRRG